MEESKIFGYNDELMYYDDSALVLIVRYDELPSESNVPVVRGPETHPYPHWHLPPDFVQLFLDAYK